MERTRFPFVEHRPLYPEPVTFAATRGTRARLKDAAERAGLPASELLRRALARVLANPRISAMAANGLEDEKLHAL